MRIGLDIGGTNIDVGLVDIKNRLRVRCSRKTQANRPLQEVISTIEDAIYEAMNEIQLPPFASEGIGVGCAGLVDAESGLVRLSENLHWQDVPIAAILEDRFEIPVRVENDANCALLGEWHMGAAAGARNVVMLTLGTGIGSGILVDGKIYRGAGGLAGEIGHTLLYMDGARCSCGRKGCAEAYLGAPALLRQIQQTMQTSPHTLLHERTASIPWLFECAAMGDEAAQTCVQNYQRYLGELCVNLVNTFRPELILLGGGIANAGDALIGPVNQYVQEHAFGAQCGFVPQVKKAQLGDEAGVIGAACLWKGSII